MKKYIFSVFLIILLLIPAEVFAVGNMVVTRDISVKNGRLFEVSIAFSGKKALSAGTFVLKYNPDAVEYRDVGTDIDGAVVRAKDDRGKTTVIFLSGRGVAADNTPLLFKVKYKLVGNTDTAIRITARDCVSEKARQIKEPTGTECRITCLRASDPSFVSRGGRSGGAAKKPSGKTDGVNSPYRGESLGSAASDDDEEAENTLDISSPTRDSFDLYLTSACLIIVSAAAVAIVLAALRADRKKREKETKE